ncbi:threonine synthase [Paenibacillus sp. Marseille-Q4541]|uniref:threonine synthase n=1 Tax=Paenibacillus sp. Marseille-Q4541 TaxID=2831522 RepID=UPI001BAA8D07|nr:threonine synthase [Paenibacillus sp. Marseille-Q4541]
MARDNYSYLSHLECPKCGLIYHSTGVQQLCSCGSPLLARYDLESLRKVWNPSSLQGREMNLWRYHELLPVREPQHMITLGEGMTPLLRMPSLGIDMSIPHLYMKDESLMPSGSFKARGAAVGISKAKELGVKRFAMPSNGNAGAAWSLYAARAGMSSSVVMPVDAPLITREECIAAGAELLLVKGLISDAGRIVAEKVKREGLYDASTLKEPYRIEGKKTMGFEIIEQMDFQIPDVILYATGGGVGLIGIYKALQELQEIGWISGPLPKLVAVQSENCAPIVRAWENQLTESVFWDKSSTAAYGINVPKAIGDFLVLDALYKTGGAAISVTEEEILAEQRRVTRMEGSFLCPEGAAAFAAARILRANGWIEEEEKVVVINTGSGLKYPGASAQAIPLLDPEDVWPDYGDKEEASSVTKR